MKIAPSAVVSAQSLRNPPRLPICRLRLANSNVALLATSTNVFNHRIHGMRTPDQRCRLFTRSTTNAAVSTIKNIKIESMASAMAVEYFLALDPEGPELPPPRL